MHLPFADTSSHYGLVDLIQPDPKKTDVKDIKHPLCWVARGGCLDKGWVIPTLINVSLCRQRIEVKEIGISCSRTLYAGLSSYSLLENSTGTTFLQGYEAVTYFSWSHVGLIFDFQ